MLSTDPTCLKKEELLPAINEMIRLEGDSFTTPYFLAMNGTDFSYPHPLEPQIIEEANKQLGNAKVIHSNLEDWWQKVEGVVNRSKLTVLKGERRTNLKEGDWTSLLPATISARTYMKMEKFKAETNLVYMAEPLASFAHGLGNEYPVFYLERSWKYILKTHTHDAHAGISVDVVADDLVNSYGQGQEISEGIAEESVKKNSV